MDLYTSLSEVPKSFNKVTPGEVDLGVAGKLPSSYLNSSVREIKTLLLSNEKVS